MELAARRARARPAADAGAAPPIMDDAKDPFLIGRFRFNPEWVHKEWSDTYFRWLVVISCAVWYNLILLLPRTVFHELQDGPHVYAFVALDYTCDMIYLWDTAMRILTGYLDNGILVREPRKLFRKYVSSPYVKWDVLSLLPTDLFFIYTHWQAPFPFLRINRLLRMGRVGEFKHRALTRLDSPNTFRLVYLILTMIVIVHLNACVYYFVSSQTGIGLDRWAYPGRAGWRYETAEHGEGHDALSEHGFTNQSSDFSHSIVATNSSDNVREIIATHGDAEKVDQTPAAGLPETAVTHPTTTHASGTFSHSNAANEADLQDNAGGSHRRGRRQAEENVFAAAIQARSRYSPTTPPPVTTTSQHWSSGLRPLPDEPVPTVHEPSSDGPAVDSHGDGGMAVSQPHRVKGTPTGTTGKEVAGVTESTHAEVAGGHGEGTVAGGHEAHGAGGEAASAERGEADGSHGGAEAGGEHGEKKEEEGGEEHHKPIRLSPDFVNDTLYQKYSYCMYWSVKMMTSKPYEIANPQTTGEFLFHLLDAFVGILLFASIVGEVDGIIESINKKSDDFKEHLDSVKQYISMRKVGKEMESRVVKWFDYIWSNNGSLNEESVLTVLPEKLRMEIAMHVHLDVLKKVPIFQGIDEQFLLELAEKLKFEAFCPGDYVCRRGDIGRDIYVVRRGLLNVIAADGVKVIVTLKAGVVFGELSLLNVPGSVHGNRRTVTVRSVGYADLYSLSKEDFWVSLDEYPEVKEQLMEKAKKILQKDNLVNEDVAREQARRGRNFQAVADKLEEGLETVNVRMDRFFQEQIELNERLLDKLKLLETQLDGEKDVPGGGGGDKRKASDEKIISPDVDSAPAEAEA